MTPEERADLHEQAAQLEDSCRMVEKSITCVQCNGQRNILKEVEAFNPKRLIGIEVKCPNCHGEGETSVEVCNACGKREDDCRCLDVIDHEHETAKEAVRDE